MTRNDRNAAHAPVPAWLGWKRNIFYAALATLVSAVFIYQLTRPHSLLGGMLGWELERIDDASREGAAATPGAITWSGLFAQLERKMPTLPDARPRAGTAQLIYAVDAVQRGRLSAIDAAQRLAPAEDAATFNLVARLAYAWLRDRAKVSAATSPDSSSPPTESSSPATPNSPSNTSQPSTSSALPTSSASLARYDSLSRIIDAQPPATTATLYNDPLHDAWRDVLQTVIRRQDVIASCVRNYRHFDIREHYAALPTIHATFTSLARELRTAGHAPQAETIRQWLDLAYMGLIDTERDYATRLLAAELLTDTRAADFYTAAPNHHRPSKLRNEFHRQVAEGSADLVDLHKAPKTSPRLGHASDSAIAYCAAFAAATAGSLIALICQILASTLRHCFPRLVQEPPLKPTSQWPGFAQDWISLIGPILILGFMGKATTYLVGQAGSAEGYLIRLAIIATSTSIVLGLAAARLTQPKAIVPTRIGAALLIGLIFVLFLEPDRGLWPALRAVDIGFGTLPIVGGILLLFVITTTVWMALPLQGIFAVFIRAWLVCGYLTFAAHQVHYVLDKQIQAAVATGRQDEITARLGENWRANLPPEIHYKTSNAPSTTNTP